MQIYFPQFECQFRELAPKRKHFSCSLLLFFFNFAINRKPIQWDNYNK